MACTEKTNAELQKMEKKSFQTDTDPVEKLRQACLSRGTTDIKGLSRTFRIMDDDGSRTLSFNEFRNGIHDYGLTEISDEDIQKCFQVFDKDGNGKIDFEEFLETLRPSMKATQKDIVLEAFAKLDKSGDGVITVEDLKGVYDVSKHPQFLNGQMTEEQCLRIIIDVFDSKEKDGKVTKEEFINYYSGLSQSIDNDEQFDAMMQKAYQL